MAGWSPSTQLLEGVRDITTRASEAAVRGMRRKLKDGAEDLSARHLSGSGAHVGLHRREAETAVISFAEESIDGVIGLVTAAYGSIPPESVDWLEGELGRRIERFAASIVQQLEESSLKLGVLQGNRKGNDTVRFAAHSAIRDLSIRLRPIRIRRDEGITMPTNSGVNHTTVYNVTGPNSRVNINSTDGSTNVVNIDAKQLFAEMRGAVDEAVTGTVIDGEVAGSLVQRIDAMEGAAADPKSFGQKYADFIQVAANHMAIFQPFLPALAQILSGLAGG